LAGRDLSGIAVSRGYEDLCGAVDLDILSLFLILSHVPVLKDVDCGALGLFGIPRMNFLE
jgi:hypothetical protein